jgi:beta-glucosidase
MKLVTALALVSVSVVAGAGEPISRAKADAQATALVAQLTLQEKVDQLVNVAPAIPRLGIPAYNWWTESLHGAIGEVPTTNFPEPIGLAATFDEPLIQDVANAISIEVRALHARGRKTGRLGFIGTGLDTWSPNINIFRDPRWGRGQETYGEDPFLTARLAVAYVHGMQGPDPDHPNVIASPKHFAVHSGPESTRHEANVYVTPHDLEDTYLPAFRAAIVEGRAGSIMCAYNRVNGQPACANDTLLKERLRGAWQFNGYVVSDCDAVADIDRNHKYAPDQAAAVAAALKMGVDNECHGATLRGDKELGNRYKEAYERGLIGMEDIDRSLIRLFSARFRNGDLPSSIAADPAAKLPSALTSPEHDALALKTAERSLVLLKNDGVLPLHGVKRIAVVGPHADSTRVLRGNYSSSQSSPPVSIVDGLRRVLRNVTVTHVPWSPSVTDGDPVPTSALRGSDGKPGLRGEESGEAPRRQMTWTGSLIPPATGTYRLGVSGAGSELTFEGKVLVAAGPRPAADLPSFQIVTLEKGRSYPLRITNAIRFQSRSPGLFWKRVSLQAEKDLAAATASADLIVAAVGLTSDLEGEEMKIDLEGFSGGDKTSLDLPADQRKLLEQLKATGKPLVVVAMNGSTIDLSWAKENAAAIIEAWYPGQAGGLAVANVIAGKTNPAGRLPLTFYRNVSELPPFSEYSMKNRTYRYFTGTPVYPFGYGLSFTTFEYAALKLEPVDGNVEKGVRVTTTVTNTGKRAGEEVAQLYLEPPRYEGAPRLALRGFQRFNLLPGEHKTISLTLSPRDLSFVTRDGVRQVMNGEYHVNVGAGQPGTGVAAQSVAFSVPRVVAIPE